VGMSVYTLPGQMLSGDHARLEQLLVDCFQIAHHLETQGPASSRLRENEAHAGVLAQLRAKWVELEEGLQNHFATEETFLFPQFRMVDMREAMALQHEHQSLRGAMLEIGGGVGVNLARSAMATRFAELLAAHTRREEAMMLRWADASLPPQTVELVRSRLQRTFKGLTSVVVM